MFSNLVFDAIAPGLNRTVIQAARLMTEAPFVSAQELLNTVKPGDLIEFKRSITYCHWAMYSDEEGMVFNVPAEGKDVNEVKITLERLIDVAGNSKVRVNNQEIIALKKNLKKRSPSEAIAAAKAVLGKTLPYNFIGTNCEYYCTQWLYGRGFTTQIDDVEDGLIDLTSRVGSGLVMGSIAGPSAGLAVASSRCTIM